MRLLFSILFLSFYLFTSAQKKINHNRLFYFLSKDSLVGVKNVQGKIIIPAAYRNLGEYKNKQPITGNLIYLPPPQSDINLEPHSYGVVFNRKGEFLFAPFFSDNGSDYLSEGMMRYVKNKKVGFVNRKGEIVISAQYDYVNSFNYGIAAFCDGCKWEYKDEQSYVTGGEWGYVNYKGDILRPVNKRNSLQDQNIDSVKFLPYQFTYTLFEQKIIDSFNKLTNISKAHFVNYYSPLDSNERILRYEIVERPSSFFPFYHIKGFEYSNNYGYYGDEIGDWDTNFFVSKNGKEYFVYDYYDNKIPLTQWLKKYVAKAREYLKINPDALYKF